MAKSPATITAFASADRLIVVGKASTISAQIAALAARLAINSGMSPECEGGATALSTRKDATSTEGGRLPLPALRLDDGRLS